MKSSIAEGNSVRLATKPKNFTEAHVHGKTCVHVTFGGDLCGQPVVRVQHAWLCEKHQEQVHKK